MTQCNIENSRKIVNCKLGFSLIEVIIALGIILVTLLAFGVVVNTIPLTRTARNQNIAYHIAAKKIEELRRLPFESLPAGGAFTDPGLLNLDGSAAALTVADYQGSAAIKQVTAAVSWYENATARHMDLTTLIGKNGLSQ